MQQSTPPLISSTIGVVLQLIQSPSHTSPVATPQMMQQASPSRETTPPLKRKHLVLISSTTRIESQNKKRQMLKKKQKKIEQRKRKIRSLSSRFKEGFGSLGKRQRQPTTRYD